MKYFPRLWCHTFHGAWRTCSVRSWCAYHTGRCGARKEDNVAMWYPRRGPVTQRWDTETDKRCYIKLWITTSLGSGILWCRRTPPCGRQTAALVGGSSCRPTRLCILTLYVVRLMNIKYYRIDFKWWQKDEHQRRKIRHRPYTALPRNLPESRIKWCDGLGRCFRLVCIYACAAVCFFDPTVCSMNKDLYNAYIVYCVLCFCVYLPMLWWIKINI